MIYFLIVFLDGNLQPHALLMFFNCKSSRKCVCVQHLQNYQILDCVAFSNICKPIRTIIKTGEVNEQKIYTWHMLLHRASVIQNRVQD